MGCCFGVEGLDEEMSETLIHSKAISIDNAFTADSGIVLKVREDLFSCGSDYDIVDASSGETILKIHHPGKKRNAQMSFVDLNGNVVALLRETKKVGSNNNKYKIQTSNEKTLGIVSRGLTYGEQRFEVQSPSPDDEMLYRINGVFGAGHKFVIRNAKTNQISAKSGRHLLSRSTEKIFGLQVARGVDIVAMVAICTAIDELRPN